MSVHSSRGSDIGSLSNILFRGQGNSGFRYASAGSDIDHPNSQPDQNGEPANPNVAIWGTNVCYETCKRQLKEFLEDPRFTIDEAQIDEARFEWAKSNVNRALYLIKLDEISQVPNEPYLTVNCEHLREFSEQLYNQLVDHPTEVIQIFEQAANELFQDLFPEVCLSDSISVRPFNTLRTSSIRGLDPKDIGKLITISGMVTRASVFLPEMLSAHFKCTTCKFFMNKDVLNGNVVEPSVCPNCNGKFTFELIHNLSKFVDKQLIKLQESPDDMPAGEIPSTTALIACADLVDKVTPGDRVAVTGIYRAFPSRVMSRQRRVRWWYRTVIDIFHYRKVKSGQLHDFSQSLRLSSDRVDRLKALANESNIYERLANSICPSIFGHIDVKKGILLQLFGGTPKVAPGKSNDPKQRHFRSEINILLCGDPGTSKSQILQHVYKLVPRGQYTSGKGSSAVGLTAYVTRDLDTKQLILQIGALVMCDGGICCIDEFDKMSDSTRSVLHEVMEQQTLSIAKAGIVCQLNARTSILAAANPVESEWDRDKTIIDNIKLPDTLLSRFDLTFLILDPNTDEYDIQLAKHLISGYFEHPPEGVEELIELEVLKDYLAYAKCNVAPELTEDACHMIKEQYIELRESLRSAKGLISFYPRNLESLIRLSEAHAKMRLSNTVEIDDVLEAIRLVREAFMLSSTDLNRGKISDPMMH